MSDSSSPKPFAGKVIAVTGAASGIGLATCKLLYSLGASIAACDINATALSAMKDSFASLPSDANQSLQTTLVDITNSTEVNTWITSIITTFGTLDHAANIAGGAEPACPLTSKTDAHFTHAIDLNLRGVFNSMRAQLPYLSKGSSIVNVSSGAGISGLAGVALYSAAKAGVQTLSAVAAKEYGPLGIRVNCIAPGTVLTEAVMREPEGFEAFIRPIIEATPLKRGSEPEEQARVIAFLLGEEASYVTGTVVRTDGGYLAMGH